MPLSSSRRRKTESKHDAPAIRYFTTTSRCNEPLAQRLDVQPPRRSEELWDVFLLEAARAIAREAVRWLFELAVKMMQRLATKRRSTRWESV